VAKIAIYVAIAASIGLLLLLFVLAEAKSSDYRQTLSAFDLTQQNLLPAMLVFGLAMVVFAGVTTGLFALYTSFRIAGPLFRIARNLELEILHSTRDAVPIRKDDRLQQEWTQYVLAVSAVRRHYALLGQVLAKTKSHVHDASEERTALWQDLAHLKKIDKHVRL